MTSSCFWLRFNPCFTGYGSDALRSQELSRSRSIVSILVLLDMALMQKRENEIAALLDVSILVLLDMALMR